MAIRVGLLGDVITIMGAGPQVLRLEKPEALRIAAEIAVIAEEDEGEFDAILKEVRENG